MATLDIARLTVAEKLDLIGELWDSLGAEEATLTPAQEAELLRRVATFDFAHDVGVAHDDHVAHGLAPSPAFGPQVEHVVQVDVGQQ